MIAIMEIVIKMAFAIGGMDMICDIYNGNVWIT
jgi:hypothetical protein